MELYYGEMETPFGMLTILNDGNKVIRIDHGTFAGLEAGIEKWARRYVGAVSFIHKPDKIDAVRTELDDYFTGARQNFTIPVVFYGTSFQKSVWQALYDTIPYGETTTYQAIADTIGKPKAVRAVGGAVNKNPFSIVVPCHRVIGANGKLVGYNGGIAKKEFLLTHETRYF